MESLFLTILLFDHEICTFSITESFMHKFSSTKEQSSSYHNLFQKAQYFVKLTNIASDGEIATIDNKLHSNSTFVFEL